MGKVFGRVGVGSWSVVGVGIGVGLAAAGCTKEQPTGVGTQPATSAATAGGGGDVAPAAGPATAPAAAPTTQADARSAAEPAGDAGASSLYTLPPSKGPAAHQFRQVTLLRTGPAGDLEMQLTGDGIYRIRDHGRGRSYAGNGKLEDAELAAWAELFKDWESLNESYLPSPTPADADKVEIIYGGKKVVAAAAGKDTPKPFADAYNRLLALNEQSKKETGGVDAGAGATGTAAGDDKPQGGK